MKKSLTSGNIFTILMEFSIPYFFACFLQNFYGLADLFIAGAFNGADTISAVSSGSQIMHMLTVIVTGLVMGSTVSISQCIGANDTKKTSKVIGNTISIFLIVALILVSVLLFFVDGIIGLISTPIEAVAKTKDYLIVCFIGLPFIIAYNVISSIFRGLGDTKTPMYFVVIAGIINIALDYVFIGLLHLDAKGAALATVISQGISVILALVTLKK